MIKRLASMKQSAAALAFGSILCAPAQAAPTFQIGMENSLGFHGVANTTSSGSLAVGDILYGIVNLNNIYTYTNGTTWNDNNTHAPYDNFTGYFAAKITGVSTLEVPSFPGLEAFAGTYAAYTFGSLESGDVDPNGVFTAADIAAQTAVKFYTDTANAFETNGSVADDISKVTDGMFWASFGFAGGGYWTASEAPIGSGTSGGFNFVTNNTGLSWAPVFDNGLGCTNPSGCYVDMAFESSFGPTNGGAWSVAISDPARLHPVPLPAAVWLLLSGLAGLAGFARRKV